mmetsp:Transcript_10040/g.16721  ORF Transcript_10040/g.16721 Transcript_10040/m.16721 type:complete len:342 (+) Transcript_10040:1132-2157(+)
MGCRVLHRAELHERGRQPDEVPRAAQGDGPLRAEGVHGVHDPASAGVGVGRRGQAVQLQPGGDRPPDPGRAGGLPHPAAAGGVLPRRPAPGKYLGDGPAARRVSDGADRLRARGDGGAGGPGHDDLLPDPPGQQGLPLAGRRLRLPRHPAGRLRSVAGGAADGQGAQPLRQGRRRQALRGGDPAAVRDGRDRGHRGRAAGDDQRRAHRAQRHPLQHPALLRHPRPRHRHAGGRGAGRQPGLQHHHGGVPLRGAPAAQRGPARDPARPPGSALLGPRGGRRRRRRRERLQCPVHLPERLRTPRVRGERDELPDDKPARVRLPATAELYPAHPAGCFTLTTAR